MEEGCISYWQRYYLLTPLYSACDVYQKLRAFGPMEQRCKHVCTTMDFGTGSCLKITVGAGAILFVIRVTKQILGSSVFCNH